MLYTYTDASVHDRNKPQKLNEALKFENILLWVCIHTTMYRNHIVIHIQFHSKLCQKIFSTICFCFPLFCRKCIPSIHWQVWFVVTQRVYYLCKMFLKTFYAQYCLHSKVEGHDLFKSRLVKLNWWKIAFRQTCTRFVERNIKMTTNNHMKMQHFRATW